MRYLAIDFGARRIGLAVSDDTATLASPHGTRERQGTRRDVAAIVDTVRGLGVQCLVFGLPRTLDGGSGDAATVVRAFAAQVAEGLSAAQLTVETAWWDERFSTREALGQMRVAGISQKRGREATGSDSVDARAAAVILQGFLDSRNQPDIRDATNATRDDYGVWSGEEKEEKAE